MLVNFNPAVNVGFRANEQGTDFQTLINRPGAYSTANANEQTPAQPSAEKKKSSAGKIVLGVVAAAVVIAGALAAMRKLGPNIFKLEKNAEATGFKKGLEYVTTYIGKAGQFIIDQFGKLGKCFKGKKTEDIVDTALDAADSLT